ncbi:alkaline phosphatase family protein [Mucilaginibacter sp. PAMB04274]|uniref:alkaline phosphatase family protein n=1 Tax=Mucilaginibacter sp. PAMB04274 TaxID=3138568 RepID=UPI0031F66168
MKFKITIMLVAMALPVCYAQKAQPKKDDDAGKTHKTLIVFFDGLRPDYINAQNMPNLFAFKQQGAYGNQHHSVFPTVTRVNSSAYSTGSYPAKTGLMGNTVYFPQVDSLKGMDTGDAINLQKINKATDGHLLTTVSLGEVLQAAGKKMMVFSSGSTGQALLQNHTVSGGGIVNPDMILPENIKERIIAEVGPIPASNKLDNAAKHQWVTDALIRYGLAADGPDVSAIWLSDPDGAAHSTGIGSAVTMASIKTVDAQFGRMIKAIQEKGLIDQINILISTDHGFITHTGNQDVASLLISSGLKAASPATDVVVSENAIYVKNHDLNKIKQIVTLLQAQPWVGAIFTKGEKAGDLKGAVAGTLSFEAIHWDHPQRAADIVVSPNWNDDKNTFGYAGMDNSKGVAGHGGTSPYEIHIPFIVSGPDFKKKYVSEIPTSNTDITPTVLYLQHLSVPQQMDGRVATEMLVKSSLKLPAVKIQHIEASAGTGKTSYKLYMQRSIVGKQQYFDFTKVTRQ